MPDLFCICFEIGCLLGETYFDSEMSGTDLACNIQVIVCHLTEPINLVSVWGKSQLCIKPSRGENPTMELDSRLLSNGVHPVKEL